MNHGNDDIDILPPMDFAARLDRFRATTGLEAGDAFMVTDLLNVRYLTGFSGSAGTVIVLPEQAFLLTDGRYAEAAGAVRTGLDFTLDVYRSGDRTNVIRKILDGSRRVFFESMHMTVDVYESFRSELPDLSFVSTRRVLEEARLVKDAGEIARMRRAAGIASRALEGIRDLLGSGITEVRLAAVLESTMRDLGADSVGFSSIVASGPNASRPHAEPTDRVIGEGELVVMDFGALVDGYHSDMTRTVWSGRLDDEQARLHDTVLAANEAGLAAVRAGATYAEVDLACREVLRDGGYPFQMAHPAGHNVGLFIHERPYFEESAAGTLRPNQVVTVEPGVYLPGVGGARVEDMVVVTESGCDVLSTAPKGAARNG